jgi:hypothetical protein
LITIVPLVAASAAFAFVVGYFSAFDIAWIPFFSLPEHTVFAIRALPVAVGASVFFLIALMRPIHNGWRLALTVVWIIVLVAAALVTVVHAHPTFALTFLLVACGAVIRYREKSMKNTDVRNILYWAITLMAMSLIIGWGSANILEKRVGRQQEIFTAASAAAIDVLAIRG